MLKRQPSRLIVTVLVLGVLSCESGDPTTPSEARLPQPKGAIEGLVIVEDSALGGVAVHLTGSSTRFVETDTSGAFRFDELLPGTYRVEIANFPDDVEFESTSKTATIGGTPRPARVDFKGARKRDAAIAGSVMAEGACVEGVSVLVSGPETAGTVTDGAGAFSFMQLRTGRYSVTISGFDASRYAFSPTEQSVNAKSGKVSEVHFLGTLVPQVPEAPTGLGATATGAATVEVGWTDASDNEAEFRLERKEGAGGAWSEIARVAANVTSYGDGGLSAGTTYMYRVRACNGAGCSGYSNEGAATTEAAGGPNLLISAMYLTQGVQTLGGEVPLVEGKNGYLRVFVVANAPNSLTPTVRVRFYRDGGLAHTETLSAPGPSVPTSVEEGSLAATWNMDVPASLIQPGLTILGDVDPGNQIAEPDETDNNFPASGAPLQMDVWSAPTFHVTFVPVRQSVNGLTGYVTTGNGDAFMDWTKRLHPIADDDIAIHDVYVTNAPVLQSNNANGAWGSILSEVNALRVAEGSSRYYYGVVRTSYSSGIAGMGYMGWPTAVGWDHLPSGSSIAAHEWGHNWDRDHAPGCGAGSPDPFYPYADGKIGVWGLDLGPESTKSPATYYDIMSYCGPKWISDYTYEAIMDYRHVPAGQPVAARAEQSLLVWGRIEEAFLVLEPAFVVTTTPTLPSRPGPYTVEAFGPEGVTLTSISFEATAIADGTGEERHFAFAIPLRSFDAQRLEGLRVSGGGRPPASAEARSGPHAVSPEPEAVTSRPGLSVMELTWDAAAYPMALVRDPATGQVISFARGGAIVLSPPSDEVELVFSDGVRSTPPARRRWR